MSPSFLSGCLRIDIYSWYRDLCNLLLGVSLRFQTATILTRRNNSLKIQSFTTSGCKDVRIRKLEFVNSVRMTLSMANSLEYSPVSLKKIPCELPCYKLDIWRMWWIRSGLNIRILFQSVEAQTLDQLLIPLPRYYTPLSDLIQLDPKI